MYPYEILGVSPDADDASIRRAYLSLVRRFPPERYPEKFNEIQDAYNKLKDEKSRLEYYLFNQEMRFNSPFEVLLSHFVAAGKRRAPKFEEMKEYLRKCAIQ